MGNNTAGTSVVDAVPASDSAAKRLTGDERRREILDAVRTVSSEDVYKRQLLSFHTPAAPLLIAGSLAKCRQFWGLRSGYLAV